ncbi:hypothetical protein ECG_07466 [Echinococcus granulosus]|uniref:Chorion class high cysteine protein 12 n=1 Tax=Echinococcus granulosus TaxID=6210 RepID=A0A068WRU4_ECHGR|nr:hypothetical protein ECG_07195 [Echinococcus granulosus]KAH9280284.1 hypothetical protein ECG_07196 [Echinococcus granulosus]KAH9280761.1 hypothetical protein ECG_07466 [Echinococcus granulosus]CDS22835.1 chorion class high cysteine protein 12 [Echinococcus granulosus]
MTVFAVVIACLVVGGFSHPKQPTFPSCQSRVCHSGANTGYGCRGGVCDYTCSESSCHGFGNAVFPHKGMQETWGSGALGKHGCYGGNCGYWSGCNDGKCSDFYDFQQCQHVKCVNGSFHGYGCSTGGNCRVVCFIDVCHSVDNYGKVYQPSIPAPKRPHYEDVFYVNKTSKSSQSTKGGSGASPNKSGEYGSGWKGVREVRRRGPAKIMRDMHGYGVPAYGTMDGGYGYGYGYDYGHGYGYDPRVGYGVPSYGQAMYPQPQMPYPSTYVSTMDPHVLQSMLLHMPNLNQLLMHVDAMLLQSALMRVPGYGAYASSMDAYTLQSVVAGLPYVRDIVASMDVRLLQQMVAYVPNIDAILSSVNLDISQTTTPNEPSKAPVAKKSDAKTSQRATDMPDAANMTDAEVTQLIISTVPSIPPQYANVLFNKEPRFVQYIIENHQNLPGLLANMNAQTLQYVAAQVPTFGKIISNLSRNTLEVVFDKLPNTAKCLADMEPEVVRAIVAKLPSLAQYAPTEPSTTAAPTTPTPTPQVQTIVTVPTTVATEAPVFTDEELEMVRSKIPLFDTVLKLMDPKKVAALRQLVPDFPNTLADLEPRKLEMINSHLSNITITLDAVKGALLEGSLSQLKEGDGIFNSLLGLFF